MNSLRPFDWLVFSLVLWELVSFEGESVGVCWRIYSYLFYVRDVTFSNYMFVLGWFSTVVWFCPRLVFKEQEAIG